MSSTALHYFPYRCVLITGASSGIGEEFALQLAGHVDQLILVARRRPELDDLASKIQAKYPHVIVLVYLCDLREPTERDDLILSVTRSGLEPDLLINNAGLGDYGEFSSSDWGKVESLLRVNIEALTHLSHAMLKGMVLRGQGAIINVSSLASLLPIPDFAVYAASKAYVTSFSEALRIELKEHRIPVLALCPGPVKTGFGEVARRESANFGGSFRKGFYVEKERVVEQAIVYLLRDKIRCYPGWKTFLAGVFISAVPISLLRVVMSTRPRR